MTYPLWFWLVFTLFVGLLLVLDLGIFHRQQHTIFIKEALALTMFYIVLALLFGSGIYFFIGVQPSVEFFTGYLIEKSLSIDNLFVFVLIFNHFQIPSQYQHRVLFWGVLSALFMRTFFILTGAYLLEKFHWIIFVFGLFLIATGFKMLWAINVKPNLKNNQIIKWLNKYLPIKNTFGEGKFWIYLKGKLYFTPLFLVLILIEISDLIFAVDSIPAIFAITKDPFIVYTSNVFALLGLRSLYFVLGDVIHRFFYLKYGFAFILILIGFKMILNGIYGEKFIPTHYALLVTAIILTMSVLWSLLKSKTIKEQKKHITGWVPGSGSETKDKKSKI